jgi:tetratricopeptide (TPR) repeat protein
VSRFKRIPQYPSNIALVCGEAYLCAGHVEEAHRLAQFGLANAHHRNMRGNEAWALRLLGAIALHDHSPAVALAETHYRQALTLAEALGMRPLAAHCHAGLGTLYTTTGHWEQARTELLAAIALYRAMAMTFWLPQTEATLTHVLHATGSLGVSH